MITTRISLPLLALFCCLVGCRAQDERRALREAVTRLEEQMKNVDSYLQKLEQRTAQKLQQRAGELGQKDQELMRLREQLREQTARMAQRTACLLYTSPSPRDVEESRMPSSA